MKLSNESPSYMPTGFTDIWKGNYHGEPVCIKAIRTQDPIRLREIESVCCPFILPEAYYSSSCQTYRRETNGRKPISHPNILPIIKVSDTPFPLCIMSPWMPDGNIIQYTQRNPDANRLALVHTPQLEIDYDLLIIPSIACTSVPRPDASPRVGCFTRQRHSGR